MADSSSADRDPVERLAEEFLERRRRGETPSLSEYVARHPELAEEIRAVFPALALLERADPATADLDRSPAPAAAKRYVRALKRLRLILDARPGGLGGL